MFRIPPLCQHSVATGLTFVAMADTAAVLFAVMTFPSMTLEEGKTVRKVPSWDRNPRGAALNGSE